MRLRVFCCAVFIAITGQNSRAADKYALLAGVTKYNHGRMNATALKYPEADAMSVADVLKLSGYTVDLLLGKQATQEKLFASLKNLEREGTADGVVLIGLFGHGVQYGEDAYFAPFDTGVRTVRDRDNNKSLRDRNGQPLLEPDPKSMVSMRTLMDALTVSPAGNKVLLADCCREDPSAARGRNAFGTGLTTADLPDGMAALFACSRNEKAFEHDAWLHGAFTRALLNQIPQLVNRGRVTAGTLAEIVEHDVKHMVLEKTKGQSSQTVTYINNGVVDLQLPKPLRQFTNSAGMQLKLIPAGSFLMGSPENEKGRDNDEGPQHHVILSRSFYMSVYETTEAQWTSVMGTEPWINKGPAKARGDYPATYVTWGDAVEFCRRLSTRDGRTYRLPTEAEWEYACRAGTTARFHFGDGDSGLAKYAWSSHTADSGTHLNQVGQKLSNAFGLFDTHGNVSEWCGDWKGNYSPAAVMDPAGPGSGSFRVLRGGSWNSLANSVRSAYRNSYTTDYRDGKIGFRVICLSGFRESSNEEAVGSR